MRLRQRIFVTTAIALMLSCSSGKDQTDVLRAAERIHTLIKNADFQSIYRESDDTFKAAGDESKFIAEMQKILEATGSLKEATPLAYQSTLDSTVGRKHILTFDLKFERGPAKERLTFTRSKNGEMQLWDLVIEPIK